MDEAAVRLWLEREAEISFSRSGGPGGQNVNKVNSKAALFVPLAEVVGLSEAERALAAERLAGRLAEGGVLVIQAQDSRSQLENRALAVERALALLKRAVHRDKPRRPTKPSRAARERRLQSKARAAEHKRNRSKPQDE